MAPNSSSSRGSRSRMSSTTPLGSVASSYQSSPPVLGQTHRQRLSLRSSLSRRPTPGPSQASYNATIDRESDESSQPDADALNEVIMAIEMRDNGRRGFTIGCAYYVAVAESLHLMDEVSMASIDVVETLLLHTQPTTILMSSRAPEILATCLSRNAQGVNGNRGDLQGAYILRNLNSSDFRFEAGRQKLLSLDFGMDARPSMLYTTVVDDTSFEADPSTVHEGGPEGSKHNQLMRLATSINIDSKITVGCAGAVLGDIQRRKTAQYLPNDLDALVAFRVRSVEMFSLFNSMFVNADTFASLQILQSEHHPNSHQAVAKESLSVYGLFCHLAVTPQGKIRLRRLFLQPSIDIDLIQERQKTIAFFHRSDVDESLERLGKDLRKIKDMKYMTMLLRRGIENPNRKISVKNSVWAVLQNFTHSSLQVRECLRSLQQAEKIDIVRKVIEIVDVEQIRQVGRLITETIDFSQSEERGRTAVKQGVDAELDERKRIYDGMDHLLGTVTKSMRKDVPEWARKHVQNCIFFPQLGFLTVVSINKETGKGNYSGEGMHDNWERMFIAEGCVYYKNRRMKEMDDEFGDSYGLIIDREIEIIHNLAVSVLEREQAIVAGSDVLGELDSLLGLAIGCRLHQWTAPEMTDANTLEIQGGRHPLQELVVPSFIANDCSMVGGMGSCREEHRSSPVSPETSFQAPSTIVLTGPNHSGKSVYLKQVAIIVYLAHIGCFVPAEHARIGITDRILTRVATRETLSRPESAFATDLRQIAFAMNFATRRSLILVDEFGKGTNSHDGAGLMAATINHFTGLRTERPKVLVATHFHEIFDGDFLVESEELAFAHMEIHVDLKTHIMEDQVTYLYRLEPGRSISSFGSRCAAVNGIDEAIVERAETIILHMARHEDLEIVCSQLSDRETDKLRQAETVARTFVEQEFTKQPVTTSKQDAATWYRRKLETILSRDGSSSQIDG
ncbi:muts domain V-domain-containing protein [Xylariaceae sp. FL1019]|nr:muts domain V-domain-containing protein [Xylariaceae sp. FL1019]